MSARLVKAAGLLGQRFLEKIQKGGRIFTLDWLECLRWRRPFNNFIASLHFFDLVEDKVILQRCLRRKIAQKCLAESYFFRASFEQLSIQKAAFGCFLRNVWATFWKISSNLCKALWNSISQNFQNKGQPRDHEVYPNCRNFFPGSLSFHSTLRPEFLEFWVKWFAFRKFWKLFQKI